VPKSRSTTDPNRAFAGGRVFLVHSYLASNPSKNRLPNSLPPVDNEHLGQVRVPAYAFPQDHHARSIRWRVEAQEEGQHASGKCVEENRQPRTAEVPACAGANDLHIQLGMVDMTDVKGPLTMPWRRHMQFQVGRR